MIHRRVGIATNSTVIKTADTQLRTMRIRSTAWAIGRTAEGTGFDMVRLPRFIDYQYTTYR
jgi:hypothetical protein